VGHQHQAAAPVPGDADGWAVPGGRRVGVFPPGGYVVDEARGVFDRFAAEAGSLPVERQLLAMRQMVDQLEGLWLAAAADFAESGELAEGGHATLASWMRGRCRLAPAEATARAKVAFAVTGEQVATGRAVREGQVSWRHAQVIGQVLGQVPQERRQEAERSLVSHATALDPGQLRRVGDRLVHCFDRDRADEQAVRRLERRGLTVAETYDGMVSVDGLLDPVCGALLLTALNTALRPPTGTDHGDGHGRTGGAVGGAGGGAGGADVRSWPQRRADALADICADWLEGINTTTVGGVRPHLSVIVDHATLASAPNDGRAVAPGQLAWTGPVTASQTQLIGCDATVSRIVTDGASQVVDVGRATRTIPPGLRRAVVARDRSCVAPGCGRLPEHCDVHHVIFWEHGGETSLDNTVLLCRHHHRLVHLKHWQVIIGPDGRRTLRPP
jgi:hypothetical protein